MFYRFTRTDVRLPIDLDSLYEGESVFIVGGSPEAQVFGQHVEAVRDNALPMHVMAINNAGTVVRPTIWVGGDKPACYSESILVNPTIMKFGIISRRKELVSGRRWCQWPNTYFFGTTDKFSYHNFLHRHRDLVWWKNTFFIALQLAYRLGFRTAYLVGCGFKMDPKKQYAWETELDEEEVKWNQRLYNTSVQQLKALQPHFLKQGFKVYSSTEQSEANGVLEYKPWWEVIKEHMDEFPEHETVSRPHSSKVSEEK